MDDAGRTPSGAREAFRFPISVRSFTLMLRSVVRLHAAKSESAEVVLVLRFVIVSE